MNGQKQKATDVTDTVETDSAGEVAAGAADPSNAMNAANAVILPGIVVTNEAQDVEEIAIIVTETETDTVEETVTEAVIVIVAVKDEDATLEAHQTIAVQDPAPDPLVMTARIKFTSFTQTHTYTDS